MSIVSCVYSCHLRLIPDLGKCFSSHPDCPKWPKFANNLIFGHLVYHFLQQIFQEYNTLGYWMYHSVKSLIVTPSLHQCTQFQKQLHQDVVTKQCLCTQPLPQSSAERALCVFLQVSPKVHHIFVARCPERSSYMCRYQHLACSVYYLAAVSYYTSVSCCRGTASSPA